MIKPGTLCLVVAGYQPNVGRIVIVEQPLAYLHGLHVDGTPGSDWRYSCRFIGSAPYSPAYGTPEAVWQCAPSQLRPLNDPDNAPADPAYTKRKEKTRA